MQVKCPFCSEKLDLVNVAGRCTNCRAPLEVYYDLQQAKEVADAYDNRGVPADPPACIVKFEDADGWVIFFRDEGRLSLVAEDMLKIEEKRW
jgi:hypothetical protein